jgi:hypothetical protein
MSACDDLRNQGFPAVASKACVQVSKAHRAVADPETVVPTIRNVATNQQYGQSDDSKKATRVLLGVTVRFQEANTGTRQRAVLESGRQASAHSDGVRLGLRD